MNHRPTVILLILLGLATGSCDRSATTTSMTGPSAVQTPTSEAALALADLTNAERARAGLTSLSVNSRLNTAAQLQADQLAARRILDHEVSGGQYPTPADRLAAAGYQWQASGENLASGQTTAAAAMSDWMNSPGHRLNILNVTFTELGTAYAVDANGRPYYVQVFARPR